MNRLLRFLIIFALLFSGCIAQPQTATTVQQPAGPVRVTVSTVEILRGLTDSADIQVVVTGNLPDGCSLIKDPTVDRDGRLYSIDLVAARVNGNACASGQVTFERVIPIRLGQDSGPVVGRFGVLVNGVQQFFEIQAANPEVTSGQNISGAQRATLASPASATNTPVPTATATPEAAVTAAATITQTATASAPLTAATATPTAVVNIPLGTTIGADSCSYVAGLYEDIDLPTGNSLDGGASFIKTWRLRNEGSCAWGQGFQLVLVDGDAMGTGSAIPLAATASGEVVQVSVPMIAPKLPGMYFGEWAISTPDGKVFGVGSSGKIPIKIKLGVRQPPLEDNSCEYTFSSEEEQKILEYINAERAKNGLPPHVVDEKLSQVARAHSLERGCMGVHSHFGADGKNYESRVKKAGIDYQWVNEIIYNGAAGAKWAVQWWVYKSKLHHDIVMSGKYSVVGIGYVKTNKGQYPDYFTVLFIAPP
jgi:uncharacterized protein YkwD